MARGILTSQQTLLDAAAKGLLTLRTSLAAKAVRVDQLNVTIATDTPQPRKVVFEWDDAAQEYAWRDAGES